jgi:DNA-3-methyladenine glycosylase
VGRIVEVEAYAGPEDAASHARFASARRNAVMSGPPGRAYVYRVYGMYDCLNVVTGPDGIAAAVLIRALEPVEGVGRMREARLAHRHGPVKAPPDHRLASGPGLVGVALGIDPSWTGVDLCDPAGPLRLERDRADHVADDDVVATPRIGIAYAGPAWADRPWRFAIDGHPSVSRP